MTQYTYGFNGERITITGVFADRPEIDWNQNFRGAAPARKHQDSYDENPVMVFGNFMLPLTGAPKQETLKKKRPTTTVAFTVKEF